MVPSVSAVSPVSTAAIVQATRSLAAAECYRPGYLCPLVILLQFRQRVHGGVEEGYK